MGDTSYIVPLDRLANELRLSRAWLRKETKAGRIPSLRAGRRILFNVAAVRRALAERAAGEGVARAE